MLGAEHKWTLQAVNNLSGLYGKQGRFRDAEPLLEQALQGYEKALGSRVVTYVPAISTMQNLAVLVSQLTLV